MSEGGGTPPTTLPLPEGEGVGEGGGTPPNTLPLPEGEGVGEGGALSHSPREKERVEGLHPPLSLGLIYLQIR